MGIFDRLRGNPSVGMEGAFCSSCGMYNDSGTSRCRACDMLIAAVANPVSLPGATEAPTARTAPTGAQVERSLSCPSCGFTRADADADCQKCGHRVNVSATAWQLDKHVVVRRGSPLPAVCVKCGVPSAAQQVVGRATGVGQAYAGVDLGLGLLGVFGDLISLLFLRGVDVRLTICDRHEQLRRRVAAGGVSSRVAMLGVVRVAGVTDEYVRLGGAADALRARLPKWQGSFPPAKDANVGGRVQRFLNRPLRRSR